jgi:drug/metabolite transporter (DMT)-like permease
MRVLNNANPNAPRITGFDLLMILTVTMIWGSTYPVMKFAVSSYPPGLFRALTFLVGATCVGVYARVRGESLVVPTGERWLIAKLSVPNMALWHLGIIYGIQLLNSGRAAIMGYTMPAWALLSSVIIYKEALKARALLGVFCCLGATFLLGHDELTNFTGHPLGVILTVGAALFWGIGTSMLNHSKVSVSSLSLTFWMLSFGFAFFTVVALVHEFELLRWPHTLEWFAIFYSGCLSFGVGYVAWFLVARKLTPVTSGLSVMLVPVIGLGSGAAVLGENIKTADIAALALILSAMVLVLRPKKP